LKFPDISELNVVKSQTTPIYNHSKEPQPNSPQNKLNNINVSLNSPLRDKSE